MSAKVTDVDKGYTAMMRAMGSMSGAVTSKVGVFGAKASNTHDAESGLSNGELAAIHEFGAGVPERSFVRAWVDLNKPAIQSQLKETATAVASGNFDIYAGMHRFGQWADLEVVKRITAHIPPPNAPATIRRKGSNIPLIDTGKLLGSIDSAVERNGKAV